ncbi:DnaD domain protein, partial [Enterococcus hirae]|nr:DnaD domain protein [Enterococcus hirae]
SVQHSSEIVAQECTTQLRNSSTLNKHKQNKNENNTVNASASSVDLHSENSATGYWLNQVNPEEAPRILESIHFWVKDFNGQDEIVIMAIDEMLKNGAKNYNYLDRVLKNWENKQLDTVEKVRKYLQGHYSKSPRNAGKTLEYEKFSTDELPI